jgi:hypothetical protein
MVTTQAMREAWRKYLCIGDHPDRRSITILGRNAGFCPPEMVEPFQALSQALVSTGYKNPFDVWVSRKCPNGIKKKKCKPDGTNCSLHNYGVAVDIDPPDPPEKPVRNGSANPVYWEEGHWKFGDIKLIQVQVEAVEAIRTAGGQRLFQWLGDSRINDTMHFEVQVPPDDTTVNWDTVTGGRPGGLLRVMAGTVKAEEEEDDMWQYLTVGEDLVQHAWDQGWLKPKTQATLDFFIAAVRSGEINEPTWGDFRNFRVAVTNGIALGVGKAP